MLIDILLRPFRKQIYLTESQVNRNLGKYLEKAGKVFDVERLVNEDQTPEKINRYYQKSFWAYRLFNSNKGLIHFALSDDYYVKPDDYFGLTKIVGNEISKISARRVLELASGKGANSIYLAQKFSEVDFTGIDLGQSSLKDAKKIKNYIHKQGDYHNLSEFEDNSFDLIFVIEALCHSQQKYIVMKEVFKKLRKGGVFIISDGYCQYDNLPEQENTARMLVERGMALNKIENKDVILNNAKKLGFKIREIDVTDKIIPTAKKFEFLARGFFRFPVFAKLITKIFSEDFSKNSLSGLFLNMFLERGIAGYHVHILKK